MRSRNLDADVSTLVMGKALAEDWEADLQALVDGELNDTDRRRVMGAIEGSIELQARYNYLTREKELLRLWWADSKLSS